MATDPETFRTRAKELRDRAAEIIRGLADFPDPEIWARMEQVAADYEKIATQLDYLAEHTGRS